MTSSPETSSRIIFHKLEWHWARRDSRSSHKKRPTAKRLEIQKFGAAVVGCAKKAVLCRNVTIRQAVAPVLVALN